MKVILFSMRDVTANCYLAPFVARSTVDAVRQIKASRDDPQMKQTPVAQYPQDFDLWEIGVFDDVTASIASDPKRIASVAEIWGERPSSTVGP